jgi:hypothetical protein
VDESIQVLKISIKEADAAGRTGIQLSPKTTKRVLAEA